MLLRTIVRKNSCRYKMITNLVQHTLISLRERANQSITVQNTSPFWVRAKERAQKTEREFSLKCMGTEKNASTPGLCKLEKNSQTSWENHHHGTRSCPIVIVILGGLAGFLQRVQVLLVFCQTWPMLPLWLFTKSVYEISFLFRYQHFWVLVTSSLTWVLLETFR